MWEVKTKLTSLFHLIGREGDVSCVDQSESED